MRIFPNRGKKGNYRYYIQVAYSVAEEKTYQREMAAFTGLSQLDKKILITNDDIDYSTSNVQHLKLKDFLLLENLETLDVSGAKAGGLYGDLWRNSETRCRSVLYLGKPGDPSETCCGSESREKCAYTRVKQINLNRSLYYDGDKKCKLYLKKGLKMRCKYAL